MESYFEIWDKPSPSGSCGYEGLLLIGLIIPGIQLQVDFLGVKLDPEKEYISVVGLDSARRHDGGLLFQPQVVAIVQVNGFVLAPAAVAPFHERRTVERAQAGEQSQWEEGTFS